MPLIHLNKKKVLGGKYTHTSASLPLIKELMPSLVTKILSKSSLPVNSSATIYKLGCNFLAASNMYCKKHSHKCNRKRKARWEESRGGKTSHGFDIGKYYRARQNVNPRRISK